MRDNSRAALFAALGSSVCNPWLNKRVVERHDAHQAGRHRHEAERDHERQQRPHPFPGLHGSGNGSSVHPAHNESKTERLILPAASSLLLETGRGVGTAPAEPTGLASFLRAGLVGRLLGQHLRGCAGPFLFGGRGGGADAFALPGVTVVVAVVVVTTSAFLPVGVGHGVTVVAVVGAGAVAGAGGLPAAASAVASAAAGTRARRGIRRRGQDVRRDGLVLRGIDDLHARADLHGVEQRDHVARTHADAAVARRAGRCCAPRGCRGCRCRARTPACCCPPTRAGPGCA